MDASGNPLPNNSSAPITPGPELPPDQQREQADLAEVVVTGNRIPPCVSLSLDLLANVYDMTNGGRTGNPIRNRAVNNFADLAQTYYQEQKQGNLPSEYMRQALADQATSATGNPSAGQVVLSALDQEAASSPQTLAAAAARANDEASVDAARLAAERANRRVRSDPIPDSPTTFELPCVPADAR